jgi:hypothetical protein
MAYLKFYFFLFAIICSTSANAQTKNKRLNKDFKKVLGYWKGSLTYLDYSSGKPYTMPADVEIKRIKKTNKYVFSNIYPNERNANSNDTITISADEKYIDKELITSIKKLANGIIEIITEEKGKDGNDFKPATFRHTYTLGKHIYNKRKDVQFDGTTEWIKRHEYSYTK